MPLPRLRRRLLVDRSVVGVARESMRGVPVWPAGAPADFEALQRTAAVFGAEVVDCDSRAASNERSSGEIVTAVGEGAHEAAALYAQLTARRLSAKGNPSVVVMLAPGIDAGFLEELYARCDGSAVPGLVVASTPSELRRQVLIRAAAATLGAPLERPRVDVYPQLPVARLTAARCEIFGRDVEAPVLREALSSPVGVLTIGTHCDGLDAYLHDDLILCTLQQHAGGGSSTASPRCVDMAFCHRRNLPLAEAAASNALMSPDDLAARMLLFDVCYGILPAGGVVDPLWALGVRLTANPAIGALITSWQTSIGSALDARELAGMLSAGVPAGVAVRRYLDARPDKRLCLFGDPRVRLPRTSALPLMRPLRASEVRREQRPIVDGDDLTLMRLALERLEAQPPSAMREVVARAAAAARELEALRDAERTGAFRDAFLDFLVVRGWADWLEDWLPFAVVTPAPSRGVCWGCGGALRTVAARPFVTGARPRRISTCALCAVIEDVPGDVSLALEQTGGTFRLAGTLSPGEWRGKLVLWSASRADVASWEWPRDAAGAPARQLTPDRWPPGPLRISLTIVHESSPLLVNRVGRAPR